jgi:hypothetical protein
MITATTDPAQLGGDNPPALPELPRIAPRTRKPVRLVGDPAWSDRAIALVAELARHELNAAHSSADTR